MTESFFRSLSLTEDLATPQRFEHYRPTRRATPIVGAILRPRAVNMVIAPYGSGKSLAAGVGALAVRGSSKDRKVLETILPRLVEVDVELAAIVAKRLEANRQGKVVVLAGHEPNPLAAIARQLGLKRAPANLDALAKALADSGDHIAIIWDEFGRHLEGLVADGRSADMDFVQRLAERAARAAAPTFSLTLLLHQNLLAYATRLNETTRSEWRKIEGRFELLRLVEDSQEFYSLVAEVVTSLRTSRPRGKILSVITDQVQAAGWLDGMQDPDKVAQVLSDARPLTAGALQILPTLVARVGQNERSLFSFLREIDLGQPVGIEQVYVAFSDAMRSDVGIGGSYRRWVEAESARSRARDARQRELIAAACLLQLGVSGERVRLPRDVLELAVTTDGRDADQIHAAVDELIASNLLLWRRHNDDVAVWHGADIDVGQRVREERERQAHTFDLLTFLNSRFPAPNVRAPGHNARFGVNRYFKGLYARPQAIPERAPDGATSAVIYCLAQSREDISLAREAALARSAAAGLILVVPQSPLDLESAALELVALEALRADSDFLASDPMVTTELDELQSVAFEQLAQLLRPLLNPRGPAADWYAGGKRLMVTGDRPGTMAASDLLNARFDRTPVIGNDQLMRDQVSRTMQTARVRIISGILERSERPRLGLEDGDRSAEGSVYRTVLQKTGLHRSDDRRFALVSEIAEPGLALAWQTISDFFRTPTEAAGRPLTDLVSTLQVAPIGLPTGVMPLLVAAGYSQFASVVGIYENGVYLNDLMGYRFDQMLLQPQTFTVRVAQTNIHITEYLREICYAFQHDYPSQHDELARRAFDAINAWILTVPDAARRTQRLDDTSRRLLQTVMTATDPLALLLTDIPAIFGVSRAERSLVANLEQARKAIDELRDIYADEAVATVREAFRVNGDTSGDLLEAVRAWAGCFDADELTKRDDLRISDRAVFARAVETANGRFSPKSFAGALSSILLKTSLDRWDDRSAIEFRTALREARERIEVAAINGRGLTPALRPIIKMRIAELQARLDTIDALERGATLGEIA